MKNLLKVGIFSFAFLMVASGVGAASYYVDSVSGSDSNSGTNINSAWKSLEKVNNFSFNPGDSVYFKAGSLWDGTLSIGRSGSSQSPIVFSSYGSGDLPIFKNSASVSSWPKAIMVYSDWVVIEKLQVKDTHEAGVYIASGADHNIVRECEITNVGIGVAVYGQYNLVTKNRIHDLIMVKNTSGGDDDYGAVGVWLFNSNNEVSYNNIQRCKATSYDYGTDGGAIEFYGAVNNSSVHHNWAQGNEGFLEIGGDDQAGRQSQNNVVSYNVLVDNTRMLHFNLGSYQYATNVDNFRFENNTAIESSSWETAINFISGELSSNQLIFRNNILSGFYKLARKLSGGSETVSNNFTHQYNLYQGMGSSLVLGTGEVAADPRFLDASNHDFKLQAGSPAIDSGLNLGYSKDYEDNVVPSGAGVDKGAFEYSSVATLSVSVSTEPSSGTAPLSGVDVRADISGTATGTTNYIFYCNRSDSGTDIISGYSRRIDGSSNQSEAVSDLCSYDQPGTYTVKVIVERGTLSVEARKEVVVSGTVQNQPPVIDAGSDFTIYSKKSAPMGATASDPDNDPLFYRWSCPFGSLSSTTVLNPTFTAPNVKTTTKRPCTFTVTDSNGLSATDTVYITVKPTFFRWLLPAIIDSVLDFLK